MNGWLPRPGLTHIKQDEIQVAAGSRSRTIERRRRVEGHAGFPAGRLDQGDVAVEMGGGLGVDRDPVRAGVEEPGDDRRCGLSTMRWTSSGKAVLVFEELDEPGAEGQVGDEVAVHDVDVDEVGPGRLDQPDGVLETGEIGGEEGRRDEDHVIC